MSNFTKALNNLMVAEGGYVFNPKDPGGETYKGISRKYHKNWSGWQQIDPIVDYLSYRFYGAELQSKINDQLKANSELNKKVKEFYYNNYWDKFNGDKLPYEVAEEMLEQSVLLGTWKTAGKNLQKALNLLNRNGKIFKDLKVDGLIGRKSLDAVNKIKPKRLVKVLNGIQFCRLKKAMEENPEKEIFVGWFDRI